MTDKVQKIREEVERVKAVHSSVSLKDSKPDILAVQVCINLLSFIDSLQEDPKFKTGDRIKPIDSCLGSPRTIVDVCDSWYVTDQGTLDFEFEDNWELVEEPVCEDLEESIKVCSEKAMLHKAYTSSPFFSEEDYAKGFVDGKDWQKQQMMKQAIEVQVNPLLGETVVGCKVSGYEVGEKVKIIIVKEGEKC